MRSITFVCLVVFGSCFDEDIIDFETDQIYVNRFARDYGSGLGGSTAANGDYGSGLGGSIAAAGDYGSGLGGSTAANDGHGANGYHCAYYKMQGKIISNIDRSRHNSNITLIKSVTCDTQIDCVTECQNHNKHSKSVQRDSPIDDDGESIFRSRRLLADYGSGLGGSTAANGDLEPVGSKTKKGQSICNYLITSKENGKFACDLYSIDRELLKSAKYITASKDSFVLECSEGSNKKNAKVKTKSETLLEALQRLFAIGDHKSANDQSPFQQYMHNFEKNYEGQEGSRRRGMFALNLEKANDANKNRKGTDDAGFGLTEFMDLSHSELIKKFTGILPGGPLGDKLNITDDEAKKLKYPKKLDWASLGAFPPIRKQGSCGSCYAFTTADLTASQSAIESGKFGTVKPLAPRYVQECGGENAHECTGGIPALIFKHISSCAGCAIPLESCYPYGDGKKSEKKQCNVNCTEKHRLTWSQMVDISGPHERELMASLLQWGPLLSVIDCSEVWQFYNGTGVIKATQCDQTQNHAILIVGYDYTASTPHYIIRNSWGTNWGSNGYAKLEAGQNSCAVAKTVIVGCSEKCGDGIMKAKDLLGKSNVPK